MHLGRMRPDSLLPEIPYPSLKWGYGTEGEFCPELEICATFHSDFWSFLLNRGEAQPPVNSSQVSDGARAVLLMKRSVALKKGLSILGVFRPSPLSLSTAAISWGWTVPK